MELLFRRILVMDGGSTRRDSPASYPWAMPSRLPVTKADAARAIPDAPGTVFTALRRWWSLRAARQELLGLDDRLLADVGLDRDTVKWELEERIER